MRTGWNPSETILTPANVASGRFGKLWDSGALDSYGGTSPHLYASPLYVDDVALSIARYAGLHFSVVVAATSNNYVYAINAVDANGVSAGTILWRAFLGAPGSSTDGVRVGVLGTPAVDLEATPPTVYVAADGVIGGVNAWRVFALDLANGATLRGWPLVLNDLTVSPVNQNGPAKFQDASKMSQRGGLNLSWDGSILYVPFGGYFGSVGWLVAIDTARLPARGLPKIASSFSSAPDSLVRENGGMWASGGASLDNAGNVYAVTGNSPTGPTPATWGESVLKWKPGLSLRLEGTYTAWNHCQLDDHDIDLCGSGVTILPDLSSSITSTPTLMAIGGKQGNAYLLDRDRMPGALTVRPACNRLFPTSNPQDGSLWDPKAGRSYYGGHPGPLNVFGPYSEFDNNIDYAKARSTPAYFESSEGTHYLFYTGSTKTCATCTTATHPCVARVRVDLPGPGRAAFLSLDAYNADPSVVFKSPGTPVVSSNGSSDAIVWVLEPNVYRSESLATAPPPTLFAIDATTMQKLFASNNSQLNSPGGKYNHPTVANGQVFVGTDRITAFGLIPSGQTLTTVADTYVRDGIYANQNFGSSPQINVRATTYPDYTREAYFKFDISSAASVSSARFRVFGSTAVGDPVVFAPYEVDDNNWAEDTLTWNNRPPLGAVAAGKQSARGTVDIWYEFDITEYVESAKSAGQTVITVGLRADQNQGSRINLHAKESGSNPAELLVAP